VIRAARELLDDTVPLHIEAARDCFGYYLAVNESTPKNNRDLDTALESKEPINRATVVAWIDDASDLQTLAKLYRLTGEGYYRIQPELGKEAGCALIVRYLLGCIAENVVIEENIEDDTEILERYEAAMMLHGWFRQIVGMNDSVQVLNAAAKSVTDMYLRSSQDVRVAIETGFLEHVLETAALRPYFEYWSRDERLKPAWDRAIKWADAHPDYMAKLFSGSRNPGKD
jgi:hypothetical protein